MRRGGKARQDESPLIFIATSAPSDRGLRRDGFIGGQVFRIPREVALVAVEEVAGRREAVELAGVDHELRGHAEGAEGLTAPDQGGVLVAEPKARVRAETAVESYLRKQNVVAVRHDSGDELVAIIEIVSRSNKSGRSAFESFVRKAVEFLRCGVHLLILDLQPPTSRDPDGIHGAIWDEVSAEGYDAPSDQPLTLAAYESGSAIRAFVEPIAVGDAMIDMPLFLRPGAHILVPLERTYAAAWDAVPRRWREVIERP